jgi:hypothetical protein
MSGTDRNQLHGAGGWCTRITAAEVTREAKIISAESIGQQFVRFFLRSSGGEHPTFSFLYKQGHGLYMSGTDGLAGGG